MKLKVVCPAPDDPKKSDWGSFLHAWKEHRFCMSFSVTAILGEKSQTSGDRYKWIDEQSSKHIFAIFPDQSQISLYFSIFPCVIFILCGNISNAKKSTMTCFSVIFVIFKPNVWRRLPRYQFMSMRTPPVMPSTKKEKVLHFFLSLEAEAGIIGPTRANCDAGTWPGIRKRRRKVPGIGEYIQGWHDALHEEKIRRTWTWVNWRMRWQDSWGEDFADLFWKKLQYRA